MPDQKDSSNGKVTGAVGPISEYVTAPILEVRGVDFSYGTVQVLFNVDMRVERGEILALLGTNGAGKSTLLGVISGLLKPQAGHVLLDEQDVTSADVVEMVGRGVGMLPGGRAVFPDMTVGENLEVGAFTLRKKRSLWRERQAAALHTFPRLAERRNQLAGSLSGGEQQQLALAKAFLLSPKLLCIDELSLGLAPVIVDQLLDSVRAVNEAGATVVLVEQSLNTAALLSQRAVFMEKGEIKFEGTPQELLDRSDIARAVFLGARDENGDSA